jgi:hypothetical protein
MKKFRLPRKLKKKLGFTLIIQDELEINVVKNLVFKSQEEYDDYKLNKSYYQHFKLTQALLRDFYRACVKVSLILKKHGKI